MSTSLRSKRVAAAPGSSKARRTAYAVASLFVNGIDPMVVIRWKDIFESLEAAVDACETAANVLEGIAIKHR